MGNHLRNAARGGYISISTASSIKPPYCDATNFATVMCAQRQHRKSGRWRQLTGSAGMAQLDNPIGGNGGVAEQMN